MALQQNLAAWKRCKNLCENYCLHFSVASELLCSLGNEVWFHSISLDVSGHRLPLVCFFDFSEQLCMFPNMDKGVGQGKHWWQQGTGKSCRVFSLRVDRKGRRPPLQVTALWQMAPLLIKISWIAGWSGRNIPAFKKKKNLWCAMVGVGGETLKFAPICQKSSSGRVLLWGKSDLKPWLWPQRPGVFMFLSRYWIQSWGLVFGRWLLKRRDLASGRT